MSTWQFQDAKAHFSELIRVCSTKGPQIVSVRGKDEVVIISKIEYERLVGKKPSFIDFMNKSPLKGLELDLERDPPPDRNIEL